MVDVKMMNEEDPKINYNGFKVFECCMLLSNVLKLVPAEGIVIIMLLEFDEFIIEKHKAIILFYH